MRGSFPLDIRTPEPPFGAMAGSLMISSSVAQMRLFWARVSAMEPTL
jgi:hypothetical protein